MVEVVLANKVGDRRAEVGEVASRCLEIRGIGRPILKFSERTVRGVCVASQKSRQRLPYRWELLLVTGKIVGRQRLAASASPPATVASARFLRSVRASDGSIAMSSIPTAAGSAALACA